MLIPLPSVQSAALGSALRHITVSPDSKLLAACLENGMVRVLSWPELDPMGEISTDHAQCTAFSPDSNCLAVQSEREKLLLVDTKSFSVVTEIDCSRVPQVTAICFSPDGAWLAAAGLTGRGRALGPVAASRAGVYKGSGNSPAGRVKIWDVASQESVREIHKFVSFVPRMAFYADGKVLVIVSTGTGFLVWDAKNWEELNRVENFTTEIVDMTPDGRWLLIYGRGNDSYIFDTQTGTMLREAHFGNPAHNPASFAWKPDGESFAVGFYDGALYPWALDHDERRTFAFGGSAVNCMRFLPDGRLLASGHESGDIHVWHAADVPPAQPPAPVAKVVELEPVHSIKAHRQHAIAYFSADGRYVMSGGGDDYLRIWDATTYEKIWSTHTRFTPHPRSTPDGKTVVALYDDGYRLRQWDLATKELVAEIHLPDRQTVPCLEFTPDGKRMIVFGSEGNTHGLLSIWDTATWEVLHDAKLLRSKCNDMVLVDEGRKFCAEHYHELRLWDANTGQILIETPTSKIYFRALAVAPDQRVFVSTGFAAFDNEVRIYSQDLQLIGMFASSPQREATCLAFSPDGRILAVGGADNLVRLWDAETLQQIATLRGHFQAAYSVSFSPDGKTLVTGSGDATFKFWDISRM